MGDCRVLSPGYTLTSRRLPKLPMPGPPGEQWSRHFCERDPVHWCCHIYHCFQSSTGVTMHPGLNTTGWGCGYTCPCTLVNQIALLTPNWEQQHEAMGNLFGDWQKAGHWHLRSHWGRCLRQTWVGYHRAKLGRCERQRTPLPTFHPSPGKLLLFLQTNSVPTHPL